MNDSRVLPLMPGRDLPLPASGASEKRSTLLFVIVVLVVGVANVLRLGTLGDWWFEDDASVYVAIRDVARPWLFFYDVAANRLATGANELAPMLLSSMWLDQWLAPRSAAWAYAHNGLVYLAVALAFYFAMLRLLRENWIALGTTIAWMLLPSTAVLVEYVSTRHYLIGMFWALMAAMSVADALEARPGGRRGFLLARVAVFTWLAIISKEFFPPAVLTLTFLWFAWRGDWRGASIPVLLGAAYAIYRVLMTEPAIVYYDIALMSPIQALKLLVRLPYMTYGGWTGYVALALTAILLRRKARVDREILPVIAIGGATLAVSLLVIYPVGQPVSAAWRSLGTWYRTPCVINTLLLVAFAYAVATLQKERAKIVIMTLLLIAVFHGSQRTMTEWDRMKAEQTAEARFMLAHPGETLVSQVGAIWFLPGIAALYPERQVGAFVYRWHPSTREVYTGLLRSSRPFWIYEQGEVRQASAETRQRLLAELP